MSNQIVNNENRINKNTTQNTETSINKKTQVNSLLQRIANGESGVVLEELLWKITVERRSGFSWKSANHTLKIFYHIECKVCKRLLIERLCSSTDELWE